MYEITSPPPRPEPTTEFDRAIEEAIRQYVDALLKKDRGGGPRLVRMKRPA